MTDADKDRNLLVAVLAFQLNFVTSAQLVSAMQQWLVNRRLTFEEILVRLGVINAATRDFLASIAQRHLELHQHDAVRSLASLHSLGELQSQITELDAPDVEKTFTAAVAQQQSQTAQSDLEGAETEAHTPASADSLGRFRILRPHAKGGLGVVSVAEDSEFHREVALKEILPKIAEDAVSRDRFVMEAEITGRLEHPGIVPVYSLGRTKSGNPFYVMRFIHGDSLRDAIKTLHGEQAPRPTPAAQALAMRKLIQRLVDVCHAIEYAHSRGVLHRDLKPSNIMLGRFGETLVVDWGLAKPIGRKADEHSSAEATLVPLSGSGSSETNMGSLIGTLAYMSPEQASGRIDVLGPHSDVYCLGATLYHVLTGQPPVWSGSNEEKLERIRNGRIEPARRLNPRVDPALEAICRKAMALHIEDRYRSARELGEDLDLWLADEPVAAWREPLARRAWRWIRRHRMLAASAMAMTLATVAALIAISVLVTRQNRDLRIARDAEHGSRLLADRRLGVARDVTLNIIGIAETVLSQDQSVRQLREEVVDQAYAVFSDLRQQDPGSDENAELFARIARISGNQKSLLMKLQDAEDRNAQAIAVYQALHQKRPDDKLAALHLIESYRDAYGILRKRDKLEAAQLSLNRATELLSASESGLEKSVVQREMAWIENKNVLLQSELWRLDQALSAARTNIQQFRELLTSPNRHPEDQRFLIVAMYREGRILDFLGQPEEAAKAFDRALAEIEGARKKSGAGSYVNELTRTLTWSAEARGRGSQLLPMALEHIAQASALLGPTAAKPNASEPTRYYWAEIKKVEGQVQFAAGQPAQAKDSLQSSVRMLESLAASSDASYYNSMLAETLTGLSDVERAQGNRADADNLLRRAFELMNKAARQTPESGEIKDGLRKIRAKAGAHNVQL